MIDKSLNIENITSKAFIYNIGLYSLFCYVFLSDFVVAVLHIGCVKPVSALIALLFMGVFIVINYGICRFRSYFVISLLFMISYIFVFKNTTSLNYFYTVIFAFYLIQMPQKSLKALDLVFGSQLILLFVEFLTKHNFYTSVTSGLFTVVELDFNTELFEETGFRAKGLFAGVLIATCFAINYSLIHRNDYIRSLLALVMSILISGRLAIIITGVVFLYNFYCKSTHYKKIFDKAMLFKIGAVLFLGGLFFASFASSASAKHLIDVFSMSSSSNFGRLMRYVLGYNAFCDYSLEDKLKGGLYELYDQWDRPVPTESEVLGILLEVGILGFIFVFVPFFKAWRTAKTPFLVSNYISAKFALFLSFISILQYRHLVGNPRGILFWFLIFTILCQNISKQPREE